MTDVFPPTQREKELLDFIRAFFAASGIMPSYSEMCAWLGVASKSNVARMIDGLIARGHLKRIPGRSRALLLTGGEVSTADAISAVLGRCELSDETRRELRALLAQEVRA